MTSGDIKNENQQPQESSSSPEGEAQEAAPGAEEQQTQPEGGESALEEQLRNVIAERDAAIAERDANYDRFLRAQAEMENYRKRVQKEMEEFRQYQVLPLVRDLLPGLDNLQRALTAADATQSIHELVEGVRLVAKQFQDILAQHSTVPIEAIGKPFDPNLHEAIQQYPSPDHPPMTVIDEAERGFIMHDRVVRPSKVVVSSGPPEQESAAKSESESE